ncbi:ester cyclase [Pendulispora rubella]|uniref:Ester cyclase n=1 Tax=Pendulispora rubella TaxID=2741070 RepID=A0ABZ2L7I2_9BACT
MDRTENKTLATKLVVDLVNERKYELANTLVSPDFRSHNPRVGPGPAGMEAFARSFERRFSSLRGDILHLLAEGDRVMVWIHWQGTPTEPAGSAKVDFETVELFRFTEQKLVEHWDMQAAQ